MLPENEKYRKLLQRKLRDNPKDLSALIHLGITESRSCENIELGLSLLEEATQLDPSSVGARFWLAVFCYYNFGEYSKAQALIEEALTLDPKSAECWCLLARLIYEVDGPLEEAINCTKKALLLAPNWPSLHNELANLLISAGRYDEARSEIESFKNSFKFYRENPVHVSNAVEWYYENVITGRGYNSIDDELLRMEKMFN